LEYGCAKYGTDEYGKDEYGTDEAGCTGTCTAPGAADAGAAVGRTADGAGAADSDKVAGSEGGVGPDGLDQAPEVSPLVTRGTLRDVP
jgi:hypothetical protein